MAGVAGPMFRRSRSQGARFIGGLITGGLAAALLLGLAVVLIGSTARSVFPMPARWLAFAVALTIFGTADIAQRTPYTRRQVPRRFFHLLPPGVLGVTWGLDIGLLFTTQKVTSLIWAAMAGAVIVYPTPLVPLTITIALGLVVFMRSTRWRPPATGFTGAIRGRRRMRTASGVLLIALAILAGARGIGLS